MGTREFPGERSKVVGHPLWNRALPRVSESGWALRYRPQLCDADLVFARFLQSNLGFPGFSPCVSRHRKLVHPWFLAQSLLPRESVLISLWLLKSHTVCSHSSLCLCFVACVETVVWYLFEWQFGFPLSLSLSPLEYNPHKGPYCIPSTNMS